jgi:hypothetical protein
MLSLMCIPFQLLNHYTAFHENWYMNVVQSEATNNLVLFSFLQSVITTWQTNELVRGSDTSAT